MRLAVQCEFYFGSVGFREGQVRGELGWRKKGLGVVGQYVVASSG